MGADPEPRAAVPERPRRLSRIELLVFLFLACRLLAWAFLLLPWGGFDEYAHHGYVETCAETPRWRAFRSVYVPTRIVDAERDWRGRRGGFDARVPGMTNSPAPRPRQGNYETQQSPAYYLGAGLLLRILPPLSPIAELYLLRIVNAGLALLVGVATIAAARRAGFSERAWFPLALLAFVPGFAIALVRVSNDALCALCLAIGIGASLEDSRGRRRAILAAASTGTAPWAKLYGLAGIPGVLVRALRRGERNRGIAAALLVLPAVALAILSRRIHGSEIALADVLTHPAAVRLRDVPWARDAWAFVKSHLWVSGMSVRVFPSLVYVVLAVGLALCLWKSASAPRSNARDRRNLSSVSIPVILFLIAAAYFATKNFAAYRSPGGVGGWYLWAMALPEALLLTWGLGHSPRGGRWFPILLSGFLLLTVAGDLALFAEPGGFLANSSGQITVIGGASYPRVLEAFRRSRPAPVAVVAEATALLSWILGLTTLVTAFGARATTAGGNRLRVGAENPDHPLD